MHANASKRARKRVVKSGGWGGGACKQSGEGEQPDGFMTDGKYQLPNQLYTEFPPLLKPFRGTG